MPSRFTVEFTRSAEREFLKLPADAQKRFARAIERLQEGASVARPGVDVKRLRGSVPAWRLRVGAYRGIYAV